jgi:hypothetical protein
MPRPSSLADAKASTLCPYSLDLHQAGHKTYSVVNVRTCNSQRMILPEVVVTCQTPPTLNHPPSLHVSQRKRRRSIPDPDRLSNRIPLVRGVSPTTFLHSHRAGTKAPPPLNPQATCCRSTAWNRCAPPGPQVPEIRGTPIPETRTGQPQRHSPPQPAAPPR